MNILVPVKTVPDPAVPVRLRPDGSGVDLDDVKTVLNPFDEIALEAAIRLRESGDARQVTAVSVGPEAWEAGLRTALAMGADRGLRVAAAPGLEPLPVARCLAALARREAPGLLIFGRQSVDGDHNQTGQMTAALLGWAVATCASELAMAGDGEVRVVREVDGGLERWTVRLPAVVTVDLRLNTPRYASLPNIMKARRIPLERVTPAQLGVISPPQLTIRAVGEPPRRPPGVRVADVAALAVELRRRGLIPSPPAHGR